MATESYDRVCDLVGSFELIYLLFIFLTLFILSCKLPEGCSDYYIADNGGNLCFEMPPPPYTMNGLCPTPACLKNRFLDLGFPLVNFRSLGNFCGQTRDRDEPKRSHQTRVLEAVDFSAASAASASASAKM